MKNDLTKDLELVLIDYLHPRADILVHHVGWVLNESKKNVLLTSELHEDSGVDDGDENNEGYGIIRKIKKRSIVYRRPIDRDVNMDVKASPETAGNVVSGCEPECDCWASSGSSETKGNVLPFTFAELDEYISMTYAHVRVREHSIDSMRRVAEWVTWKFTKQAVDERRADAIEKNVSEPVEKVNEGIKRAKEYVRDQAEKREATDLLIGYVTRQQAKYERWWLHRVPVEINGGELNPGHFKIVNVDYRVNLKNKGEVKIILQDNRAYIIEAKEGKPYPKKSQVKVLEEVKG